MKASFDFVIEPKGSRYNNTTKVGSSELIINTEIYNHQFVNREAIVKSVPTAFKTDIQSGDTIVIHHNVLDVGMMLKVEKEIVGVISMKTLIS